MSVRNRFNHRWSRRHMHDYVDGDLTYRQRDRLRRHAEICPECGPMLRGLLHVVSGLRQLRGRPRRSQAPAVIALLRTADDDLNEL